MIKFKKFVSVLVAFAIAATVAAPSSSFASTVTNTQYEVRSKEHINFEGGSPISLGGFTRGGITAASGRAGTYYGPGGYYLVRDWAVNSGAGPHGGSYWKLFNRSGRRVGTYDRYGNYLRP